MEIIFTKGSGKYDRMEVVRSVGTVEVVECPKQGIIPHDMVHFVVESTLEARGFIARVAEGEAAKFQMVVEAETDGVERLVEVFQADGWSGWRSSPEEILELYRVTCGARECPPLAVSPSDVEAVRRRLLELTDQWQSVPVGHSLTLHFQEQLGEA